MIVNEIIIDQMPSNEQLNIVLTLKVKRSTCISKFCPFFNSCQILENLLVKNFKTRLGNNNPAYFFLLETSSPDHCNLKHIGDIYIVIYITYS